MLHSYRAKSLKASQQGSHVTGHLHLQLHPIAVSPQVSHSPCSASGRVPVSVSMFQSQGGQRQDQHSHIPEGKVVSVAETVSTCRLLSACTLLFWPSTQPNPPLPHPQLLDFCERPAPIPGPCEKKKKKSLPAQLGSAQLGSVQPFSYTRPTLHLCE